MTFLEGHLERLERGEILDPNVFTPSHECYTREAMAKSFAQLFANVIHR